MKITECKWLPDMCSEIKTHIIVLRYRLQSYNFRDNVCDVSFFAQYINLINMYNYTTLTNFGTKCFVLCKVYTDVGGIN